MRKVDRVGSGVPQPRPVYRCMQCRQDFDREDRVRGHQSAPGPHARAPARARRGRHSSTPGQRHAASAIDFRNAQLNMDVDVQHAYFGHNMHFCLNDTYLMTDNMHVITYRVFFFWPPQSVTLAA